MLRWLWWLEEDRVLRSQEDPMTEVATPFPVVRATDLSWPPVTCTHCIYLSQCTVKLEKFRFYCFKFSCVIMLGPNQVSKAAINSIF